MKRTVVVTPPRPLPKTAAARRAHADDKGHWRASLGDRGTTLAEARTLTQLRDGYRREVERLFPGAAIAEVLRLPRRLMRRIEQARVLRTRAERLAEEARAQVIAVASALTDAAGLSFRDAAELLGISHQRVHQLLVSRK